MSLVYRVLFMGVFIGCVLKFSSPHKHLASWMLAGLVGASGAIVGLFVSRVLGFGQEVVLPVYVSSFVCAAAMVMIYARNKNRLTRPTIVF